MRLPLACLLLAAASFAERRQPPLGLDLYMPVPEENPLTPKKIGLGRRLFNDRGLSRDGSTSCATCHQQNRAFSDGRRVAIGVNGATGIRNSPSLVNRGYNQTLFWDGRAASLEQQVIEPLVNPREMKSTPEHVTDYVRRKYRRDFEAAFGHGPEYGDVARALASYVRTIQSGNSRFDRFREGRVNTLTTSERAGMLLFHSKAGCSSCHVGPNLTDDAFHNTGVAFRDGKYLDAGRFDVSHAEADMGAFRTPGLREVARTAPYMHDGSIGTLEDVVEYYNRGGNMNPRLDSVLRPLHLTPAEKANLVAFLRVLTGVISEGR
jgi:cytochrome c peroxidase